MRTIDRKILDKQNAKYDELQKDKKSDIVKKAFEHKAYETYTTDDYLRKVGIAIDRSTEE